MQLGSDGVGVCAGTSEMDLIGGGVVFGFSLVKLITR
jgi:hypothetical protein